jgi:hypothetical protein
VDTGIPSISFVCVVESGFLEPQTVRLVESLRRWGGRMAGAPIIAVTPRFGPPLARVTHQALDRLGVRHVRATRSNYVWFPYLNKARALVVAEAITTTETICFLDSDMIIAGEPDQLILNADEDFACCAPEQEMGTTGPDSRFHSLFEQHCKTVGMTIDDLPWITTETDRKRIRLYFNAGVIVYRRTTAFVNSWEENCVRVLDSHVISDGPGFHLGVAEQAAIGFAVLKLKLRWRALTDSHNYPMCPAGHDQRYSEAKLREARIIHYHEFMWPAFWPTFMKCMHATYPEVADWLESLGPMKNLAPLPYRVLTKILNYSRKKQASTYRRSCKVI